MASRPTRPVVSSEPLEPRRLFAAAPSLATAGDLDVAYDGSGTLHLAWYDAADHDLKYASRAPSGDWTDAVVVDASPADAGAQVSIALDAAGLPAVAYRDATNADLKFARRDAAGAWAAQTVDGKGKADAGVLPDLAFDAAGSPVISYYRPTGRSLRLATLARGRWSLRNVSRVGGPERAASSVAVNPTTGQWAVAYQHADGSLRYSALTGRKVRTALVDPIGRGGAGASPSLAFNAAGVPGIGYYDLARAQVKIARPEGAAWGYRPVGSTNGQAPPTLLVDAATGRADLVFRDGSGDTAAAGGALTGSSFPVRDLLEADDGTGAAAPAVALDPVSHLLVAAYPGTAGGGLGVLSALPAAQGLAFSNVTADAIRLSWAGVARGGVSAYEVQWRDASSASTDYAVAATLGPDATSFDFTGLPEGHGYWFRVITVSATGYRTPSAALQQQTLALAPTALAAHAASTTRINLTWQDNSQAEQHFVVQRRAVGQVTWNFLGIAPVNATGYADTTAQAGTAYEYRVAAYAGGTQNFGPTNASATTPVVAPLGLVANNSIAPQVTLDWVDAAGESGYRVERSPAGADAFVTIADLGPGLTHYTDAGLPEDVKYDYRVRSLGPAGPSGPSGVVTTAVRVKGPGTLSAVPLTQTSLTLNWADNSAAETAYEVQTSVNNGAFFTFTNLAANVTSYDPSGLAGGNTYRFRVRARGANTDSEFSTSIEYSVAPNAPAGLTAVQLAGGTKMDLAWTDTNANETGYKIERSRNGGGFAAVATVAAGQTNYVDSGLSAAAVYRYRVSARGPWGQTPFSNVAIETDDARPTGVTATALTQTQVRVAWSDHCPVETSYEVRYGDGVNTFTATAPADATSVLIDGLTAGADYTFEVSAVQDAERRWTASPVSAVMLLAPQDLAVNVGDGLGANRSSAVTLTWTDVNDAEGGYGVERSTDGGVTWEFLADVAADETTYTDDSLPEDAVYAYRVYAYNLNGAGAATAPVVNSTPTWLNAPTGLVAAAVNAEQIELSWTDNSGSETGYLLGMSIDGDAYIAIGEVGADVTTFSVTADPYGNPLVPGTRYSFRVLARNANNASDYSNEAGLIMPS